MLIEISNSLVLRFDDGQYSFRHFESSATDDQLYELALELSAFSERNLQKIFRTKVFEF